VSPELDITLVATNAQASRRLAFPSANPDQEERDPITAMELVSSALHPESPGSLGFIPCKYMKTHGQVHAFSEYLCFDVIAYIL